MKTIEQVLATHGIEINRHGYITCPSHDDNHPSCKVNDEYVFCFTCHYNADAAGLEATLTRRNVGDVLKAWSNGEVGWQKPSTKQPRAKSKHEIVMDIYITWVAHSQSVLKSVLERLPEWLHDTAKEQIWDVFDGVVGMRKQLSPHHFQALVDFSLVEVAAWADRWLKVKVPDEL